MIGSAWEAPWQARQRSLALKAFEPPDEDAAFYGDSLFTSQRFADVDPAIVERLREASLRGWEYAFENQDRVIARMRNEIRGRGAIVDLAGFARYQSEIARRLAHFPGTPLGRSSPERWTRIEQSLIEVGAIPHPVDLRAFLYDPNARAGGGVSRLFVLVAGTVVALLAASLLWQRRRYRALPHLRTRPRQRSRWRPISTPC